MFKAIGEAILDAILYGIALLFYYIEVGLAKVLDILEDMFEVFVGLTKITYKGDRMYLLDVFLGDELIGTIYKGMALIGFCMLMGFTIIAVIKKMFDSTGEKMKQSYGDILVGTFKSGLLMFLMTALVMAATTACSTLLTSVKTLFNSAAEIANPQTIYFDEKDYANMFRVIDTVANYSMNPSPETRFNVNICFNEISADMQTLESSGMFRYTYEGAENSWQYYLRKIYIASDIHSGIPVDEYNDAVSNAILAMMDQVKYNSNFKPLSKYSRASSADATNNDIGRMLMVSCSLEAAKNEGYNGTSASVNDALRAPYYSGALDIYNRKTCENAFNLRFDYWHHLVCLFTLVMTIISFIKMIFNCTARIFNIILLYIVAPPFISVMPLDGGGKLKQWTTAFVIQSTSVIGVYISIRLMLMFIPIIMDGDLVLFSGSFMNALAKCILVVGIVLASDKSSGMITGILADNAGMQSVMAGEIGGSMLNGATGIAKAAIGGVIGLGSAIAGKLTKGGGGGGAGGGGGGADAEGAEENAEGAEGAEGAGGDASGQDPKGSEDSVKRTGSGEGDAGNGGANPKENKEQDDIKNAGDSTFKMPDVSLTSSANVPLEGPSGGDGDVAEPIPTSVAQPK